MRIGLIDVDNYTKKRPKYPNLALMKLSAHHKAQGDSVEWWNGLRPLCDDLQQAQCAERNQATAKMV